MRIVNPSYFSYIIHILWSLKIINTETASLFWPYVKICSVLGIVSLVLAYNCGKNNFWTKEYSKKFFAPLGLVFPNHLFLVHLFKLVYKFYLLKYFPRNEKYNLLSLCLFLFYCLCGLIFCG